ncbi:MAG: hypothetical protein QOK39_1072, partial [Acidimicrobiaceae bacterium]|nr:hypothetical protein [Acidimicrobiaceae bacterium]
YAEATRGQDLDSCLGAHIHAWYCGVATVTVPDNLKAGVRVRDRRSLREVASAPAPAQIWPVTAVPRRRPPDW